jgi:hypothetical protein
MGGWRSGQIVYRARFAGYLSKDVAAADDWRPTKTNTLDEIVQAHRNAKAAQRLLKRLLHKQGCRPRPMITDKLGSYAAARGVNAPGSS